MFLKDATIKLPAVYSANDQVRVYATDNPNLFVPAIRGWNLHWYNLHRLCSSVERAAGYAHGFVDGCRHGAYPQSDISDPKNRIE